MTFTYDVATDIGRIRLAIGDTVAATADLSDEEIAAVLAQAESWQEAAARCVDVLIARYSRQAVSVRVGPLQRDLTALIGNFRALRQALVEQYGLTLDLRALTEEELGFAWVVGSDEEGEY
jgi:hypothetical protein